MGCSPRDLRALMNALATRVTQANPRGEMMSPRRDLGGLREATIADRTWARSDASRGARQTQSSAR
eukprot:2432680-Alexandrium_andersonii.AAC.1